MCVCVCININACENAWCARLLLCHPPFKDAHDPLVAPLPPGSGTPSGSFALHVISGRSPVHVQSWCPWYAGPVAPIYGT